MTRDQPTAGPVILGAGLTGLACALRSPPATVLEAELEVGGKARSRRRDGHTFDVTGHWLHLRNPEVVALVEQCCAHQVWLEIDRETRVLVDGRRLDYPYQANLHGLGAPAAARALKDCVAAQLAAVRGGQPPPTTFLELVRQRFGRYMAEQFFVPYNRKLWGPMLEHLTSGCMHRFLPAVELDQIIAGAVGEPQLRLGYNPRFRYPRAGGIDHLPRALARAVSTRPGVVVETGQAVQAIDLSARRLAVAQTQAQTQTRSAPGVPARVRELEFGPLVSTMPLPHLIACIEAGSPVGFVPGEVREAAAALSWISWRYFDVGLCKPCRVDYHWAYVPGPEYPFFRIGVYSNANERMAPAGRASLYVELADRDGEAERDWPDVQAALQSLGVIREARDVAFWEEGRIEVAYVVEDEHHGPARETIETWLASQRVLSTGRYGGWKYSSMEDSILDGLAAAKWLGAAASRGAGG